MQLKLTLLKMLVRTPYYCTYMHKTEGYFCSLCWLSNSPINVPGSIHTFSLEFSLVFQLCSETLPSEGSENRFSVHIHSFPLSLLPLKPMTLPIWYEYCVDPYTSVEIFCWSKISHCFLGDLGYFYCFLYCKRAGICRILVDVSRSISTTF